MAKKTTITLSITQEDYSYLREIAKTLNTSMSKVLEDALRLHVGEPLVEEWKHKYNKLIVEVQSLHEIIEQLKGELLKKEQDLSLF